MDTHLFTYLRCESMVVNEGKTKHIWLYWNAPISKRVRHEFNLTSSCIPPALQTHPAEYTFLLTAVFADQSCLCVLFAVPPEKVTLVNDKGEPIEDKFLGPFTEGASVNITCVSSGGILLESHVSIVLESRSRNISVRLNYSWCWISLSTMEVVFVALFLLF